MLATLDLELALAQQPKTTVVAYTKHPLFTYEEAFYGILAYGAHDDPEGDGVTIGQAYHAGLPPEGGIIDPTVTPVTDFEIGAGASPGEIKLSRYRRSIAHPSPAPPQPATTAGTALVHGGCACVYPTSRSVYT